MKLQEQINKRDMTAKDLAEKVGTDAPMISKFANYRCLPIPEMLKAICKVLGCEISDIYSDKELYVKPIKQKNGKRKGYYKLTVELPQDARNFLKSNLKKCGYKSVTDWIAHCYKNLQIRYKIIERAEREKAFRPSEKPTRITCYRAIRKDNVNSITDKI
ncbi:MAG: helix-turn-helix transcriptional regulator [Clostridia bacterium]|nr:helix-turn-helix transcriptional regulator [Clostridia bacterium]